VRAVRDGGELAMKMDQKQKKENLCNSCGYPDWWADNDCSDCGGMTHQEALEQHICWTDDTICVDCGKEN
jgi:hypothetical protein